MALSVSMETRFLLFWPLGEGTGPVSEGFPCWPFVRSLKGIKKKKKEKKKNKDCIDEERLIFSGK